MGEQVWRAVFKHAHGAFLPQIVNIVQHLLAQGAKDSQFSCIGAQIPVADADAGGLVFNAHEPEHARLIQVAREEPAVAQPVAQGVAATIAPHRGAGKKPPHLREKRRFVVKRTHLDKFTIFEMDHTPYSGTR